ncbi:hypothetical protein LshimejAT787_0211110 [Lyophyllum shimeji]|uniref:Fungal-type protein kinase domain-containing protein n=1 Tax=Lyophyllum shimeji TaxID=47721 RepID=A0A9P3ULM8_LYOSH|nr:hypothetical protein LshimejAT787_0211110 [Lyophyllum shimeji]
MIEPLFNRTSSAGSPLRKIKSGLSRTMTKHTTNDVKERLWHDVIQKVPDTMVDKGYYANKRWEGFPVPGKVMDKAEGKAAGRRRPLEKELYGAFVNIANAIHEAAKEATKAEHQSASHSIGATKWVDYHSRSPESQDVDAAEIRPDCLNVMIPVQKHAEEMESHKATNANNKQNEVAQMAIWWLQIVAAVEMKRSDSTTWQDVVKQLIGYLRQILREQLDRRFVFGFTLGPSRMSVWMHDRSGVLGTETTIDIHKEPRHLIRLIAAFAVLPADRLGYDLTMRLYVSPTESVPSFQLDAKSVAAYRANPYDTRWVIRLNDGTEYLTVKTLSIARAGIMRGRGTIAWVVVPVDQTEQQSEIFVLKQSWRPVDVPSEGVLYKAAIPEISSGCSFVGEVCRYEDVEIHRKKDETGTLIREGLIAAFPSTAAAVAGNKRQRSEGQEPWLHIDCTDEDEIQSFTVRDAKEPVSRVRTRVLLSTYGWPVKYFSTLRELLQVFRDAIKGHQYLYDHGVLHRDISPGNIIIEWLGDHISYTNSRGRLIDLDRAKEGNKISKAAVPETQEVDPVDYSDVRASTPLLSRHIKKSTGVALQVQKLEIEPDVVIRALEAKPNVLEAQAYMVDAVSHTLKFGYLPEDGTCSPEVLHWEKVSRSYNFVFAANNFQRGSRTGTPPYTSGEILSGIHYFQERRGPVNHDAVHDLESFFWVLVHICMTRNGPGGGRRIELTDDLEDVQPADLETYQKLRTLVYCLFDSEQSTLLANKRESFSSPDDLEPYILKNFHPYFDPLRPLIEEWFSLLRLAYRHHAYEYHAIHDRVIALITKTLNSMQDSVADPLDDPLARQVLRSRMKDIEQIRSEAGRKGPTGRDDSAMISWETSPRGPNLLSRRTHATAVDSDGSPKGKKIKLP